MREIGGYLELENSKGEEYYPDLIALNTGRNALEYLIRARKIKKVYLPYYLCDSVSGVCKRCGCDYDYYHIKEDFRPDFDGKLADNEWIYIVNYFGQISNGEIGQYKEQYKNIIFDNVQAFFQKPVEEIDTIYSCRKFFGVPDGAYLATDAPELELKTDISMDRMRHLLGRYECESASEYYSDFVGNDESFINLPLMKMSKLTHNLLKTVDYEFTINRRTDNFEYLEQHFNNVNRLKLAVPCGPFMYPLCINDGAIVRKQLHKLKVYIPTLWPNVITDSKSLQLEYNMVENILPIPVDQRYGIKEMKYVIEEVFKCLR